jgi:DNA-binding response OmpR family regulator
MSTGAAPIVVFVPDLLMRQQLVGGLEAAGFAAKGAATAARLATALETRPAAILVELDGVGIDGPAVVTELKAGTRTADVPVVGFCAHTRTELIQAARDAGADRVVSRGELTHRLVRIAGEVTGDPATS